MSNREELPESFFSTDEFLNSDRGDVFVGYGSLPDKSPMIEDFFQLPRTDFDAESDIIQESIEIPQPATSRIILDGSDSGSDSGISGEHPQSGFIGFDGRARQSVIQRSSTTSPPFLTSYPAYVISKQPTSLGQPQVHRSSVNIVQDTDFSRHGSIVLASPQDAPLAVSEQLVEVDSPITIDHRHLTATDEATPVTGLVLTANDLMMDSGSIDLPDDDYCVKEEPYNPKMHSILQSKVKIQPRPNVEAVIPNNIANASDTNYAPMAKRVRSSSNIKTVVPTMVTGEDTAEIVYTPQTTFVLNSTRDTITLPPSLQVKTEPFLTPTCSIEQPTVVNTTSAAALKSNQMSDHVFVSMYETADGMRQFKFHNDRLEQQSFSTNDIVERGRLAKKQERMIKNRQAASLSRQRKKEYLETLEGTLDALKRENRELRKSNNEIRRRYDELTRKMEILEKRAQTASLTGQSSNSSSFDSVSSFLSPSDSSLTLQSTVLNNSNIGVTSHSLQTISSLPTIALTRSANGLSSVNSHSSIHHNVGSIQYSPQLRRKGMPTVTTALAASSALAFFCLLCLNLNSQTSLFDTTSQWRSRKYNTQNSPFSPAHSGALSQVDPIFGALNVRQPMMSHNSRNLLSVPYSMESKKKDGSTQRNSHLPQCPVISFNSTESKRVASELNQFAAQYKKEAKLAFLRDLWNRKTWKNKQDVKNRHRESKTRRMHMKRFGSRSNAIQVHRSGDPRMDQLMLGFRRRNDTIYFVSLTGDHFIFPAINTSKNQLSRPKVSFIMPAVFGLNDTVRPGRDQIAMMQIDSEVLNYTVFHLDKRHLSSYFKANPFWSPSKSRGTNVPPDQQ